MLSPFSRACMGAFRPPPPVALPQVLGGARAVLVTDGEELEATPAIVAGFCGLMGWSLSRVAKACAEVASEDGGPPPALPTLRACVRHGGELSPRERAVLEEAISRHCWVAVERDRAGLVLKGPADGR